MSSKHSERIQRCNDQSGYYLQQNMGKQGLCNNLMDSRGLEMMHKLAATADTLVENYRPLRSKSRDPDTRSSHSATRSSSTARSPRTGTRGRIRRSPGFGLIAQAKSGAMAMLGRGNSGRGQHNRDIAANLGHVASEIDTIMRDDVLHAEEVVGRLATAQ